MTDRTARQQPGTSTIDAPHWTDLQYARIGVPLLMGFLFLVFWEAVVQVYEIRHFVLPAPSLIAQTLVKDWYTLVQSLWTTMSLTLIAFVLAVVGGVSLAVLFSQNRLIELGLFPYAVVLQVTPVVAIAPLIIIWVGFDNIDIAMLIMAWIVAFFPILSNTTIGLRSVDHNLRDLFQLYGASRWQILWHLQFPNALPYLIGGMKISAGLSLIGVVVAEFVASSGAATGLGWRIVEAGFRLNIARMFACLVLLSLCGIGLFLIMQWLERRMLCSWHESALKRDS
jgi:NitT/TauT family transport system permease protein